MALTDDQSALILGITFRAVEVAAADKYALRGDALKLVIEEDIKNGLVPFFVSKYWLYSIIEGIELLIYKLLLQGLPRLEQSIELTK